MGREPHCPIFFRYPRANRRPSRPTPAAHPMSLATDTALLGVERLMVELVRVSAEPGEPGGEPATPRAARQHLEAGGQRVRARLALHACERLGVAEGQAMRLAACAELLHNASLVHDDLQDREELRRGRPSVWAAHGADVALCAGDLLLSAAFGALADLPDPSALPSLLRCAHAGTARVIRGQCSELATKDRAVPDLAGYERIVIGKSGALLGLPLELAFVAARREDSLPQVRAAAHAFGIGYQMVDDLEDAADDAARDSLNILHVLATLPGEGSPAERARLLAAGHLETAARQAGSLPLGAGSLLADLALALAKRADSR